MKKLFLSTSKLLLAIILITGNVNAQKASAPPSLGNPGTLQTLDSITNSPNDLVNADARLKNISVRAIKEFNKEYKEVANLKRYNSGGLTVASYKQNEIISPVS